jgi:hypothetical protein
MAVGAVVGIGVGFSVRVGSGVKITAGAVKAGEGFAEGVVVGLGQGG